MRTGYCMVAIAVGASLLSVTTGAECLSAPGPRLNGGIDHLTLRLSVNELHVERMSPVRLAVDIENRGDAPATVALSGLGIPCQLYVEVRKISNDQWVAHALGRCRGGTLEYSQQVQLGQEVRFDAMLLTAPRESGRIGPGDLLFSDVGEYSIRVAWKTSEADRHVYSNEIRVAVSELDQRERRRLCSLGRIMIDYQGGDQYLLDGLDEETKITTLEVAGLSLVEMCVFDGICELEKGEKEERLIESLGAWCESNRESRFAAYVAKYVGVVYVRWLEEQFGVEAIRRRVESGREGRFAQAEVVASEEYGKARAYLDIAERGSAWPSWVSPFWHGIRCGLAQDATGMAECVRQLRQSSYGPVGIKWAAELERLVGKNERDVARILGIDGSP